MTYLEKYGLHCIPNHCPMPPDGNVRCLYDSNGNRDCIACWNREVPGTEPLAKNENGESEDIRDV